MIDFKEYTRIRDIVVKRNKRAAAAGFMPVVHFPTVKEIRSGVVDAKQALKAVSDYYSSGSQVKTIRQTGLAPEFKEFAKLPAAPSLSSEQKREKRRQQQRDYRRRKRIRDTSLSAEQAKKYESYLKALDTVNKTWKRAGFDIGISLKDMTPSQAQAFVEYMDYRFSQGDFTQRYVIDEFIQDFSRLVNNGHKPGNIIADFNAFLENRAQLANRADSMEGLTAAESLSLWDEFVGD